jgi:DNA-binding NtrC family response regulator
VARLLVVTPDAALLETLCGALRDRGHDPVRAATAAEGLARIDGAAFEAVVVDLFPADGGGLDVVRRAAREGAGTASIALAGTAEEGIAAMRLGAFAYLARPVRADELELVAARAVASARAHRETESLRARLGRPDGAVTLAQVERAHIESVLRSNGGHRGKTARALGIDPKTLYNKLGPERPRRRRPAG